MEHQAGINKYGSGSAVVGQLLVTGFTNGFNDRATATSGSGLNGEQRLTFNSSNILTVTETGTGNGMGGIRAATANTGGNAGYGFITNDTIVLQ